MELRIFIKELDQNKSPKQMRNFSSKNSFSSKFLLFLPSVTSKWKVLSRISWISASIALELLNTCFLSILLLHWCALIARCYKKHLFNIDLGGCCHISNFPVKYLKKVVFQHFHWNTRLSGNVTKCKSWTR